MEKFKTVDELVRQLKPVEPVYCIRKKSIQVASKIFQKKFPGKTPIVVACQKGRFEDVKLLITWFNDMNGSNGNNNNMTLKEYVNQKGGTSNGYSRT